MSNEGANVAGSSSTPQSDDATMMTSSANHTTTNGVDVVVGDGGGGGGGGLLRRPRPPLSQKFGSEEKTINNIDNDNDTDNEEVSSSRYIVDRLKRMYHDDVVEAERQYHMHFNFCLPTDGEIKDSEFEAKPMVLLIGQYSTGKTTFLNHLLGEDFPGMHIGPEPTTDKFMALYHGRENNETNSDHHPTLNNSGSSPSPSPSAVTDDDLQASGRLVKGNTLTVTPDLPFSSLSQFGSAFLNHFVGSSSSAPLLKRITFIDTPGVLSGEKQRINRTYDFPQVAKWFADRSDLILLLFDAHKLDISDEFKEVIDTIRLYNNDKIRCVLNKADCVTREQLVRVYGSLMWSMGKIFDSPEVVRVYTGSYWNGALTNDDFEHMFAKDENLLVRELVDLPRCAAERKINHMVNRIRSVRAHVCILGTVRGMTPRLFGKKKSRDRVLKDLESIMDGVRVKFDLSKGDMPDPKEFARCLNSFPDFGVFPPINKRLIRRLGSLIEDDIPEIVTDADVGKKDAATTGRGLFSVQKPRKKSKGAAGILGAVGRIITFCLLLLSVAEGIYYWSYSRPAHSLLELHDGCMVLVSTVVENFALGDIFANLHHERCFQAFQGCLALGDVTVKLRHERCFQTFQECREMSGSVLADVCSKLGLNFCQ